MISLNDIWAGINILLIGLAIGMASTFLLKGLFRAIIIIVIALIVIIPNVLPVYCFNPLGIYNVCV
jgi:hypothetical protein